ncbi:MAG: M56 family metallopeptidase, partial [Acetatifactor sp.]|nr:M56 family metallopeptidase [Acetatifactor sp.]
LALRLIIPFGTGGRQSSADMAAPVLTKAAAPAVMLQQEEGDLDTVSSEIIMPQQIIVEIPAIMAMPIMPHSDKESSAVTLLDMAAFVWGTGCLGFVLFHLLGCMYYRRTVGKKGSRIEDGVIEDQLSLLSKELGIKRKITLIQYPQAASPMVIGLLKPLLVLSEDQYSAEELYFVLKHELIHLKRHDILVKLLFIMANALHWFNPIVWRMRDQAVVDMEMSCDERVVQGAAYPVRKAYTEVLFSTIHKKAVMAAVLSTQFCGEGQVMKRRFENILEGSRKKNGLLLLMGAAVLTIGMGAWIGCSVAEAGELLEKEPQPYWGRITAEENPENMDSVRKGLMHNAFVDIQNAYAVYAIDNYSYVLRYTWDGGRNWDKITISLNSSTNEDPEKLIDMEGIAFSVGEENTVWNRVTAKYGEFPKVCTTSGKYLSYSDLRTERRN